MTTDQLEKDQPQNRDYNPADDAHDDSVLASDLGGDGTDEEHESEVGGSDQPVPSP